MKKLFLLVMSLLCLESGNAQQYWNIDNGGNSITWQVKKGVVHQDHIEMGGKRVATVLRYGVNADGGFELNKSMVWPTHHS